MKTLLMVAGLALAGGTVHEPCCGPITPAGAHVKAVLDGMNVESLWLAHEHVNWETGQPDKGADYEGPGRATHCSAFAAAVGKVLGVYMLRPPEHGQILLASAQAQWFGRSAGRDAGWSRVDGARAAQTLANQGSLVVIVFESPNPHTPGHIAIVRPSEKSEQELEADGPQVTQAGERNYQSVFASVGFKHHSGAWPDGVRYYAHAL